MISMMTWTFFQVDLHFTKVVPNFVVVTYYFLHFLQRFCWEEQIHFQFGLNNLRKFVCFDLTVVVALSLAPVAEFITKNLTQKKFRFGSGLHIPAKNFKEIIKIKSDYHNILNNFCEIKFTLEECPSHHNDQVL